MVYDVSAYTNTDEYGMAIPYPTPQSSVYGHITIFSPGVNTIFLWEKKNIRLVLSSIGMAGPTSFDDSLDCIHQASRYFQSQFFLR